MSLIRRGKSLILYGFVQGKTDALKMKVYGKYGKMVLSACALLAAQLPNREFMHLLLLTAVSVKACSLYLSAGKDAVCSQAASCSASQCHSVHAEQNGEVPVLRPTHICARSWTWQDEQAYPGT